MTDRSSVAARLRAFADELEATPCEEWAKESRDERVATMRDAADLLAASEVPGLQWATD